MISVLVAMWVCVVIGTSFDLRAMFDSGLALALASIAIYCLPYTEKELDEIEDSFKSLIKLANNFIGND